MKIDVMNVNDIELVVPLYSLEEIPAFCYRRDVGSFVWAVRAHEGRSA